MLRLNNITLRQFKNYEERSIGFTERIVGISGRNGVGKTNLLDAIHYLCFTRSYFSRLDSNNILYGSDGFRLEGEFELWDKREKAICVLRAGGKKDFSVNGLLYEKFSEHIGRYPCVIVAPDDINIITGGSEERRRFVDTLLSQLSAPYLQQLIRYSRVLQQRSSLLRVFAETGTHDLPLLAVLNEQIVTAGEWIFGKRREFLLAFLPLVTQQYEEIARSSIQDRLSEERLNIFYDSELLLASLTELLRTNQAKDLASMRTTSGIHRDDLEFSLNDQPLKSSASQGQRKSLLFALKLAEMGTLKTEKRIAPILLLDDVFEKLDNLRVSNLLQRVCVENSGQVFITDTSEGRLHQTLSSLSIPFQLIQL